MSNQDRAAEVIADLFKDAFHNPQGLGEDIAESLADAGVLAPDLPEPTLPFSDGTKSWFIKDRELNIDSAVIHIFNGEILLRTPERRFKESPTKMRELGLALLAAANHTQEEA